MWWRLRWSSFKSREVEFEQLVVFTVLSVKINS